MAVVGLFVPFCIFISEDTFGSAGKRTALHVDGKNST